MHVDFNHTGRLTLKEDETLLPKNSHPKKKTSNQSLKVNTRKTIISI